MDAPPSDQSLDTIAAALLLAMCHGAQRAASGASDEGGARGDTCAWRSIICADCVNLYAICLLLGPPSALKARHARHLRCVQEFAAKTFRTHSFFVHYVNACSLPGRRDCPD